MARKIHYAIADWTRCGIKVNPHMKAEPSSITTDDAIVTCRNCQIRSGGFIHTEELEYILKNMVDIFTSMVHQEDVLFFKKEHPGLKWNLGFEEAIYEFADRKSGKELMIAALIKAIKEIERKEI